MPDVETIRVILPRPQVIRINTTAEGGGGATEFIDLTDVPQSYSGAAAQIVRVNAGETGLEFASASGGGNVSNSGTPTVGQMAQWTNATTIKGVTVSGSGATISINTSGVIAISAIANASLTNSAITIAGTSTALGGTISRDTITGLSTLGIIKRTGANTLAIAVAQTDYWDTTTFAVPGTIGLVPDPGPNIPASPRVLSDDGTFITVVAGGGAPIDANYVVTHSDGTLTDEVNLGALTTGLLKHTVSGATSTPATAVAGTDYTDNAFKTIVVSGQSNVVADSAADTLTFAVGAGISITTNATTDTITITNTGVTSTEVSDTVYGVSWDGVTTIAPSKNALYDKIETLGTGNVSASGTPTVGQMAQWTNATTVKGVTISGSGATITVNTSGVVTISGIANASLSNSTITIAGTSTALGGTITLDTITGVSSNGLIKRTGANTLAAATAGTDYTDNAFKTFSVSGQSDVVADTAADTLTLAAGSNITLTTNASTDTITIASSGSNAVGGSITYHGDSNYSILTTDKIVATNATITTVRTWTMPAASTVTAGYAISIIDLQGTLTTANRIAVVRSGSDTFEPNGLTQLNLVTAKQGIQFTSDGVSKWYINYHTPGTTAASGALMVWDNNNTVWRTSSFLMPDLIDPSPTSGKIFQANGTNVVLSTPTWPTSASTTGKMVQSNGTNLVMSTATWPTTNTSGYLVRGDGTNYSAYPQHMLNSSVSDNTGFAADTYLVGSSIVVAAGDFKAKGQYRCVFDMVKTGAGTAATVITLRVGTAGTTSDAAILTFTFGSGTADIDSGQFEIIATFRTVGGGTSAVVAGICRASHNLSTTGLFSDASNWTIIPAASSGFATNSATTIGLSVNGGSSFAGTNRMVQASLSQP